MVVLDQLPEALRTRRAGATRITDVRVEVRDDAGEPTLSVILVLSDPPSGHETWPIDDLWKLRRITREVIADIETKFESTWPGPWSVAFEPEHADVLDADDAGEVIELEP